MSEILRGFSQWVADHGGVWGTPILALVSVLLGYGLVMFVLSTVRALIQKIGRPSEGQSRVGDVLVGLVWCGLAVALLVWYVRVAIKEFPEWLGI